MFKIIKNFPNYKVNEFGIIINIKRKTQLTQYKRKGYMFVTLSNKKTKQCRVHRIVGEAFIENPNNYACINHKDENKENNHYSNLEWCNNHYNNTYGTRIEKQSKTLKNTWNKKRMLKF